MTAYHRYLGLTLVIIALAGAALATMTLEGPVPVHWNIEGKVDGWMESPWGLLILPGTMLAMFLVFQVIGVISPRGFRLDSFRRTVGIFQNALLFFLALVFGAQLLFAAGIEVDMTMLMLFGIGGLFIVIGNFLGKTRKNFFIGIRTPWTLASDEVWIRTHRLGGWMFVLTGAAFLVLAPFGVTETVLVGGAIVVALVPTLYSLWLYKRLEGFSQVHGQEEDDDN